MRWVCASGAIGLLVLCFPGQAVGADLEQIISHEHPLFKASEARLTVGQDGRVYLSHPGKSGGGHYGFVLRLTREGKDKFGSEVVPYSYNATANRDGVMATANPGPGGHRVAVYDPHFRLSGVVDDFDRDGHTPTHVEAGSGGDFYGLDQNRSQIVRGSPAAKQVKVYPLPGRPKDGRLYWDFRVCEKAEVFYLLTHPNPTSRILCVGFDAKERWVYGGGVATLYAAHGLVGAFDADDDGTLYVLDGEFVKKFAPDGKPAGEIKPALGDAKSRPGAPGYGYLRVHGDDLLLKRAHETELFRRYDLKTGALRQAVSTEHERLTATLDGDVWTAGRAVPCRVRLTAGERTLSPHWRVWARSFAALDYREFPLKDGAIEVPADCAGFYLVKVTPEVWPWQRGAASDYIVRTVVEIRQPGAKGSATILTPDNRSHFGRGEDIPFTVAVRLGGAAESGQAVKLTVRLVDGDRVLASGEVEAKVGDKPSSFKVPGALTAALRCGIYTLTVTAPGRTCVGQPVVIGPGLRHPPFHIVQHGDYNQLYPSADVWDAPDLTAAHASRTAKLGVNLMLDRIGAGDQLNNLAWDKARQAEMDALAKRLVESVGGVAPERARMVAPLAQTLAAYGSLGVEQMAGLVSMDGGLPLGKPYDQRKREEFARDIERVTEALKPYPAFRGWSWAANWWVWESHQGVKAARTAEERDACVAALKRAHETGAWDPVLDKVSDYRLGYAVEAQDFFNATLRKLAPDKVTASSGPYRGLHVYPPITFANVDEVDLHYQAEQVQWPNIAPHNVDFQKRPGKRAWGHPELHNDSGTGDQILPTLFQMVMRGTDGVGCSGPVPSWGPQPGDERSPYAGTASVFRAVNGLLRQYGPWLTTLRTNDGVAIVVSGRMCRLVEQPDRPDRDEWKGIGGRYFTRVFEAYQACLHAHYPASLVFAEDLAPDGLKRYKAVLVVGQTVEPEPALAKALRQAKAAGAAIFFDGTCRPALVKDFTPLGTAFDKVENDPSVWQDDAAYLRFPGYYRAHRPALLKGLGRLLPPVAAVDNPEVLLTERAAEEGHYLFVVNNTVPDLDPGQLWRVTLAITTRVPLQVPVRLRDPGSAVYDVFALKRVEARERVVEADLHSLPARVYAILPAAIGRVELRGPKGVKAGQAFVWSAEVQDENGRPVRASVPLWVRLLDGAGSVLDEQFTAAGSKGATGTMRAALNAGPAAQTLEATELFSGRTARLSVGVEVPAELASLLAGEGKPDDPAAARPGATARGDGRGKGLVAPEETFGPHIRDLVIAERGTLAVMSAMNWDHNLYAVDVATGELRWRQRAGHYFAFSPQALSTGLAVQGYDLKSAEGYHLYLVSGAGKLERRFALYGLPKRLPHRFSPGVFLGDRINNFAVPKDGSWVAAAGDLGLAAWARDGKLLWSVDWWKTGRQTAALAALGADTLLAAQGLTLMAYDVRTGRQRWQVRLAPAGEAVNVAASRDGKTCAVQAGDGGRVYVVREGKVVMTVHGEATAKNLRHLSGSTPHSSLGITGIALSADGSLLAVTSGNLLKLYSVAVGLRWILPADDGLHSPRFSPDGKRIAVGSKLGSLYVLDAEGSVLLERDLGALPVPAWLPDGDLLVGTWMGTVCRLDGQYAQRWRTRLLPAARDMREKLLADDGAPTARIAFRGNAEATPAPLTPNLLDAKSAFIKFVWEKGNGQAQNEVGFAHDSAALMDGKPDAPAAPWISWPQINWYAEGSPFTYLRIDAYRTQLRVTGITLVEDPAHAESWLRDAALDYWDASRERWVFVQPLLSDAEVHTHRLAKPVEAARFRIVLPKMLCGNLRLGEVVLHGEKLGPSHTDVAAKRPVAVLFDEGNDLSGYLHGATITLKGAHSGARCLTVEKGDAYAFAPFPEGAKAFGHTLPNWDFEIAEEPKPGQYRYLQFACRALEPGTKGINLRLDNGETGKSPNAITIYVGQLAEGMAGGQVKKVADAPPGKWQVVRVDLWELFKRPVRIRAMRLTSPGGSAAFDRILLGRTEKDLASVKE